MSRVVNGPTLLIAVLSALAIALVARVEDGGLRAALGVTVVLTTLLGAHRQLAAEPAVSAKSSPQRRVVHSDAALAAVRQDRRNPINDRATGLFADWYVRLRLEEEISRAARFDQRFTVVTIRSPGGVGRDVTLQLATALRHVDYAADLGPVVAVVLPNTGVEGAQIWRDRLALPASCDVRIHEYPKDGKTVSALLGEEQWAWPSHEWNTEVA